MGSCCLGGFGVRDGDARRLSARGRERGQVGQRGEVVLTVSGCASEQFGELLVGEAGEREGVCEDQVQSADLRLTSSPAGGG